MIWAGILNSRANPARRSARVAVRVMRCAAVSAVAGLAGAGAAAPALAAQHTRGTAVSHTRPATGQHMATHQMNRGTPWAHTAAGGDHTCGIRTGGTLWCWGSNFNGQLGIGNHTNQDQPQQVTIPAPGGWASITAGDDDTCATRTDGTLWCWGYNGFGQLGIGNRNSQVLPRQVSTPAAGGWASVTVRGDLHTCATRTDGTLWCWGYNGDGELGIGNHTNQKLPQQVTTPAPGGWASVTAGYEDACATRTGGTLWCWGDNYFGELGIGSRYEQDLPRQITTPAPGGWADITIAEIGHICATRTDGTLWCWGYNGDGELGIGNHTNQKLPQQVTTTPAPGGWASVTAGAFGACATRTGGTLWCWGDNESGQLGIGNHTNQDQPRQVTTPAPGGWASVTAGAFGACATRTGGTLWCWGGNYYGQLGTGSHTDQDRPRQVTDCAQSPTKSPTRQYLHRHTAAKASWRRRSLVSA